MLGLGLAEYVPEFIYFTGLIVVFLSIFYKVEIGLLFLVPLLPLQNVLNEVFVLQLEGYPGAWNIIDIIILSMIIGWILQHNSRKNSLIEQSPLNVPIAIYITVTALGVLKSYIFLGGETGDTWYLCLSDWKNHILLPVLFFITFNNVRDEKWMNFLIIAMLISILLSDYFFQKSFAWVKSYHYEHSMRISGIFTYLGPNELGAFFAQYLMIIAGLLFYTKRIFSKLLLIMLFSFTLYCLLYSFSRAGYLAFVLCVFFLLFNYKKKLLFILVLVLLSYRLILPVSVIERIDMTFLSEDEKFEKQLQETDEPSDTLTEQPMFDDSAQGRMTIWENALDIFWKNPLLGCGYSTFINIYGFDTHNNYVKFLAELGISGFLIYLYLYYLSFKSGWRLYKIAPTGPLKGLGLGFTACVIANIIGNLTHDNWTYVNLMSFYWVFLALVLRAEQFIIQRDEINLQV